MKTPPPLPPLPLVVTFRARPSDRLALKAVAAERGCSVSDLIRRGLEEIGALPAASPAA